MKFFTSRTKGSWLAMDPSEVGEGAGNEELLRRSLAELLQAEQFLVLCGLGTSLCITNGDTRLAPTMLDLWNEAENRAGVSFADVLKKVHFPTVATDQDKDIELLLSRCQLSEALEPKPNIRTFIEQTEAMIVERCSFLTSDFTLPEHESFLRRIARRSTRAPRTQLYTTNYDLCFEHAASRIRFVAVDGFSHTLPQEFDEEFFSYDLVRRGPGQESPDFIPNVFQLCKLHGSVDWERQGNRIRRVTKTSKPVLIYPRHTKFESSYEPPFLEVMGRFQSALRRPNTALLVIGFGFKDKHLSEPILAAVRSNVGLQVAVVDPAIESSDTPAFVQLRSLVSRGDARISLIAAKFEEFVPHVPDLVAVTEEERHIERLRRTTS